MKMAATISKVPVNITSHNAHGLKGNIDYTASMLKTNNVIFICEHNLLRKVRYTYFAAH